MWFISPLGFQYFSQKITEISVVWIVTSFISQPESTKMPFCVRNEKNRLGLVVKQVATIVSQQNWLNNLLSKGVNKCPGILSYMLNAVNF